MVIDFPCLKNGKLKEDFRGQWYNAKGLNNLIINAKENASSNISFIVEAKSINKIKEHVIPAIVHNIK